MLENDYKESLPDRRSIRLYGFDYSSGNGYFVTICCEDGTHRFGRIVHDEGCVGESAEWRVELNASGRIVEEELRNIETRFNGVIVAGYIVMPNHVHFMLINDGVLGYKLSRIVGSFKSVTGNRCLQSYKDLGQRMGQLWQRNYYEHIIRGKDDFDNIMIYMYENPTRWGATH